MKTESGQRIIPNTMKEYSDSLQGFSLMAAEVVDACTAAILLSNLSRDQLRIAAFHTSSDKFNADANISVSSSIPGEIFTRGVLVHQGYYHGDSSALGLYSGKEPVLAYMAAPIGTKGLLWLDTRKAYKFTGRHLRLLLELARTLEGILELTERLSKWRRSGDELELVQLLTPMSWNTTTSGGDFFDKVVSLLVQKVGLDGALTATFLPEKWLCLVTASKGFSSILKNGRLVRLRQGWVKWALDHDRPVIISGLGADERSLTLFHPGEAVGFEMRSLAVIPWSGADESHRGVLALASKKSTARIEEGRRTWEFLGSLAGLVWTSHHRERLLNSVRKYDGESGVASEGFFRHQTRLALERAREKKGSLILLLTAIENVDEMYIAHDYSRMRQLLEGFADKLLVLTRRACFAGKFRTGGFALLVENPPSDEIRAILKKAESTIRSGTTVVEGQNFFYEVRLAMAHYPADCSDIQGLWRVALERLRVF